jgi:hypothetical protein
MWKQSQLNGKGSAALPNTKGNVVLITEKEFERYCYESRFQIHLRLSRSESRSTNLKSAILLNLEIACHGSTEWSPYGLVYGLATILLRSGLDSSVLELERTQQPMTIKF